MACDKFHESIIGRLYGETTPEADAELAFHIAGCSACRTKLDELARVRKTLRESEPRAMTAPRLIVLRERTALRPALLAASILGAALVAGLSAGGGYALVQDRAQRRASHPTVETAAVTTPALTSAAPLATPGTVASYPPSEAAPPITREDLAQAFARFERRVDSARATDLRYMMAQLADSEARSGQRIGQTNNALRYVALASNPGIGAQ